LAVAVTMTMMTDNSDDDYYDELLFDYHSHCNSHS